jgi:PAS domain S-box-containing protein
LNSPNDTNPSNLLLSFFMDNLDLGVIQLDGSYNIVYWNDWIARRTKIARDTAMGCSLLELFPEITERGKDVYIKKAIEQGRPSVLSPILHEWLIPLEVTRQGKPVRMMQQARIIPIHEEDIGAILVIEDVTEQIHFEREIVQLNQVLRTIRDINQLITHVESEDELYRETCDILVRDSKYSFAWIGVVDPASHCLEPVAFAGLEDDIFAQLKIGCDESDHGNDFIGRTLKTGDLQVLSNIYLDVDSKQWHGLAQTIGSTTTCAIPFVASGLVAGVINVYSSVEGLFEGEPLLLLEEMCTDVGFAVSSLREKSARQEAETRLALLVESSADHIFMLDGDANCIFSNDQVAHLGLVSGNELVGLGVREVFGPEVGAMYETNIKRVLSGGETVLFEHDVTTSDGPRFLHQTMYPIIRNGTVNGIGVICHDMTELNLLTNEVKREKAQLEITLRSIGDAVIATNIQGEIVFINGVALDLTAWKESEAIGKQLSEVFHIINQFTRKRCEDPVSKVIKTGYTVGLANHTVLICKDGRELIIEDSAAPIRTEHDSEFHGVVLVFRDVTEEHKLKLELEKMQRLESLGLIAGGIAHDFNNMLCGILSYVTLAREGLPSKNAAVVTMLQDAERACINASALTNRLLTFAKGGAPVVRELPIAQTLDENSSIALSGSNVNREMDISPDLWMAKVDPIQIGQVISNIVINARQAMPMGGALVIRTSNLAVNENELLSLSKGNYITISFEDSGSGIDLGMQSKIFDPYFSTKQEGRGLGLATCFSIVGRHGGLITVYSEIGKGATFTLYLPSTGTQAAVAVSQSELTPEDGEGKILIMDDEKSIRITTQRWLSRRGYKVMEAQEGSIAVEMYREAKQSGDPFDIVILDLTVPSGMGGKEAMSKLIEIDPNVKAIVTSGYSNDTVMANHRAFGFCGMLIKPFALHDLGMVVREVMDTHCPS